MKGFIRKMLGCAIVALLVLAVAAPAALASGVGRRPSESLDDAVASGRLSASIVEGLRAGKASTGLVSFDGAEALRRAASMAPAGGARVPAMIRSLRSHHQALTGQAFDLAGDGAQVLSTYGDLLPTALVRFTSEGSLLALLNAPGVLGASSIGSYEPELTESLGLVGADQTTAAGYRGQGTSVAVIDTGVDYTRAAFGGCTGPATPSTCTVVRSLEYGDGQDGELDDHGHGTNVAGIVQGVAPGTKILALDVFTSSTDLFGQQKFSADDTDVIAAIKDVIAWRQANENIRAINLSLGNGETYSTTDCTQMPDDDGVFDAGPNPYTGIFQQLRQLGVLPVVAAGNDAWDSIGNFHTGVSYPACTPGAIRVGAVYDAEQGMQMFGNCYDLETSSDMPTCFSQTGPNLTLFAPGAWIDAAGISSPGTSQAAPHVVGAVAVLAAARPSASVDQIQTALATTGPLITDQREGITVQKRRLNVQAALNAMPAADTTPPAVSTPSYTLTPQGRMGSTDAPVTLTWTASDASGISKTDIWRSTNGATYQRVATLGATTSYVASVPPGSSHRFVVRVFDAAGNFRDSAATTSFRMDALQETNTSIRYSSGWTRLGWTPAYGGYQSGSRTTGAWAKIDFTAKEIAWVASTSSIGGEAYVYVDGVYRKTVNLYSTTTVAKKLVLRVSWTSSASHTLEVRVAGTAGHPQVDVDAFVVLK